MANGGKKTSALLAAPDCQRPELHLNAAIMEVADPALLVELAGNPKVRRCLLAKLSETVALVDPGRTEELAKALVAAGQTPKIVKGEAQ